MLPGTLNTLVGSNACLSAPKGFKRLYKYSSIAFHKGNALLGTEFKTTS